MSCIRLQLMATRPKMGPRRTNIPLESRRKWSRSNVLIRLVNGNSSRTREGSCERQNLEHHLENNYKNREPLIETSLQLHVHSSEGDSYVDNQLAGGG